MIQYTLRNVSAELDRALREAARQEGKSLNQTALEILERSLGVARAPVRRRDLSDLAGSWKEDGETAAALAAQRRIDPEDWR